MRFDSIRWRLVASYVLITVLTVSLVGVLTLTLLSEYIRGQAQAQLQANAEAIAVQADALLRPYPRLDALYEMTRSLSFLSSFRILILDSDLNVVIDSGTPDQENSIVWLQPDASVSGEMSLLIPYSRREPKTEDEEQWIRKAISERHSLVIRIDAGPWGRNVIFEQVDSGEWIATAEPTAAVSQPGAAVAQSRLVDAVRVPIGDNRRPLGYVQVQDVRPTGAEILQVMRNALLLAGLGAAVIAVIAGLIVSSSLTTPLKTLAESATQMSGGNLAARAPLNGAGEIKRLAGQFNTMAERLQASFMALSAERDALRRFIADASHELRTPITALSSFIELLQGPAADDQAAREEFLTEAQSQVKRMEWITAHLLDLSRLDAGLVQLNLRPVPLSELLESAAAPFVPRAAEKGIRLAVNAPDPHLTVTCDQARIEMALGNLLENALKYTPGGGWVTIRASSAGERVLIRVEDSGVGIDPEDLPHVFERFYRGRAAQPGSGLGLAIVNSLVQLHSGEVQVESVPGQGTSFTISLPS
jgi:signal transduction histidine kinase